MLPPPKHAHAPFDFGPLQDMNFADTFMLSSELKVPEGTSKEGEEGEESETANGAVDVEDDFAREDAMWVHERRREHCVMTLSCIAFFFSLSRFFTSGPPIVLRGHNEIHLPLLALSLSVHHCTTFGDSSRICILHMAMVWSW